jgi:hypothetical protein
MCGLLIFFFNTPVGPGCLAPAKLDNTRGPLTYPR